MTTGRDDPFGDELEPVRKRRGSGASSSAVSEDDGRPPYLSDDALARRFAELNAKELRWVEAWGTWYFFDGRRWAPEKTLFAREKARLICRESVSGLDDEKLRRAICSDKTVGAVERMARSDRQLAGTTDQWDRNPLVINHPGGTFDLATMAERQHIPEDYITKIAAVAPAGKCDLWEKTLSEVTDADLDVVDYLARAFGYGATGSTKEHALFFLYGTGGNGKSLILNTVSGVLGDYSRAAPIETFTASPVDRHPTDLASLRGARFVTASETEEGRRWDESRIKSLTGGDRIAARFMRQDFFEYDPQFKLFIAGNHKPGLRTVDEAIRRRFQLVPFNITIPAEQRDPELARKLRAEWPGILRWIISGARAWQCQGLRPPPAVVSATDDYLAAEDALAAWIADRCDAEPDAWSPSAELFSSWSDWAKHAGEYVGSRRRFAQRLEGCGYRSRRHATKGRGFVGLYLKYAPLDASSSQERERVP